MEIEQVFLQLEKHECHSLCITSTNPGEGVSSLAQALTERHLLAGYRTLLVDLNLQNPSLTALSLDNIPAQSIAGCCDGTIMVVLSGQTLQTELKEALTSLDNHHANLIGHVFNDKYQPRLKNEICREIERLRFLPNVITNKLIAFIQNNRFLSTVV
jgi:Mrp family chromosome partitioning ATPase